MTLVNIKSFKSSKPTNNFTGPENVAKPVASALFSTNEQIGKAFIEAEFEEESEINTVITAFPRGNERRTRIGLLYKEKDGSKTYKKCEPFSFVSSGETVDTQRFYFKKVTAVSLRIIFLGNADNTLFQRPQPGVSDSNINRLPSTITAGVTHGIHSTSNSLTPTINSMNFNNQTLTSSPNTPVPEVGGIAGPIGSQVVLNAAEKINHKPAVVSQAADVGPNKQIFVLRNLAVSCDKGLVDVEQDKIDEEVDEEDEYESIFCSDDIEDCSNCGSKLKKSDDICQECLVPTKISPHKRFPFVWDPKTGKFIYCDLGACKKNDKKSSSSTSKKSSSSTKTTTADSEKNLDVDNDEKKKQASTQKTANKPVDKKSSSLSDVSDVSDIKKNNSNAKETAKDAPVATELDKELQDFLAKPDSELDNPHALDVYETDDDTQRFDYDSIETATDNDSIGKKNILEAPGRTKEFDSNNKNNNNNNNSKDNNTKNIKKK